MSINLKCPLTYEEQINLLKSRNLVIKNEKFAVEILSHINYYRLSAYGLGLRENDVFKKDTTFEHIYQLYQFDTKFKYLLLEIIEAIEIMVRTKIAHYLAMNYGSLSYLDSQYFEQEEYHIKFIDAFRKEKDRQKNTAFVKHHDEVYGGNIPVWAAVELFSFGMISQMYSNLRSADQKNVALQISDTYGTYKLDSLYLKSWLKCVVEVRNICAHYGRIYNRKLNGMPKLFKEHKSIAKDRIFATLLVLGRLTYDKNRWKVFVVELMALVEAYSVVKLDYIGFPDKWQDMLYKLKD